MKIDCGILVENNLEIKRSKLFHSNREVLTNVKAITLGDQDDFLRCLSSYDVIRFSSPFNEANK